MKITILGSTGSVGTQTLEVINELKASGIEIDIAALSAFGNNIDLLIKQIQIYRPAVVCVGNKLIADRLADFDVNVLYGEEGLYRVVTECEADLIVNAIVGFAGTAATYNAVMTGRNIALANKESLVAAGELVMPEAKKRGIRIIPVDSEHSAIFQCLQGNEHNRIEKLILTASGGPFFGRTLSDMENITVEQALKHPTWNMGAKITIDSATLVNKGLEIIEAHWLFSVPLDDIEVLIHRESIIHSMVQFEDGCVMAQMSEPSMHHPILYAISYPNRCKSSLKRLSFTRSLTFAEADELNFPSLALAKEALRRGGFIPAVMNAANEVAVGKFLQGSIKFTKIPNIIEGVMVKYIKAGNFGISSIQDIIEADAAARITAAEL